MKAVAMCCVKFCAAVSVTDVFSAPKNHSCIRWSYAVRDLMKGAYPELEEHADRVSKVVHEEERRFAHTLDAGLSRLEADLQAVRKEIADAQRMVAAQDPHVDSGVGRATMAQYRFQAERGMRYRGDHAFKLYDTFGLPFDFIMDACRDAGIALDVEGFERAMEAAA